MQCRSLVKVERYCSTNRYDTLKFKQGKKENTGRTERKKKKEGKIFVKMFVSTRES